MPLYFSFLLFFSQRLPSGSPAGVFDLFWKCAESREDFAELNIFIYTEPPAFPAMPKPPETRCVSGGFALFVVLRAGQDGFGAVELLQEHDPGQVVGEGHVGQGQAEVRQGLDLRGDAVGRAQQEAEA